MTNDNYIVDEVRTVREEILAEYGGDVHALIHDLNRQTDELAKSGRTVVTRGPRPILPDQMSTRKVG